MYNLTETEKAYLAGLFDGEGCIGFYEETGKDKHFVMVTISNTDFRIMKWLDEHISFGSINAKHKMPKPNWKQGWTWQIRSREEVQEFLTTIQPYLLIKKEQAALLLSHLDAEQKTLHHNGRKLSEDIIANRRDITKRLKLLKMETYTASIN